MANISDICNELFEIKARFSSVLQQSKYTEYDDLSGLDINYEDPEELLLVDELRGVLEKIERIHSDLSYLQRSVKYTGQLHKNFQGRYELDNGHYFTSGSCIEVLLCDETYQTYDENDNTVSHPYWTVTSIEHDQTDYYLVGHKNVKLEGLTARIRKL